MLMRNDARDELTPPPVSPFPPYASHLLPSVSFTPPFTPSCTPCVSPTQSLPHLQGPFCEDHFKVSFFVPFDMQVRGGGGPGVVLCGC